MRMKWSLKLKNKKRLLYRNKRYTRFSTNNLDLKVSVCSFGELFYLRRQEVMKRRFGLIKCIGAFFRRSITGCGQKSWHVSEISLLDLPTVWAGQINHLLYPFVQINLPWWSTDRLWNKTVLSQTASATKRFHQAAKHPLWLRRHRRHLTAKPIVVIFSELIFSDRVCTLLTNCKTVGLLRQLGGKKKKKAAPDPGHRCAHKREAGADPGTGGGQRARVLGTGGPYNSAAAPTTTSTHRQCKRLEDECCHLEDPPLASEPGQGRVRLVLHDSMQMPTPSHVLYK